MSGLDTPLTPLRFLARAAEVHPHRPAVLDGERRWTWQEFAREVTVFAQALRAGGVRPGDRVAVLGSNSAELLAAHFAVPLVHAVLVAVNTRLRAPEVAYICEHSGATLLLGDAGLLANLDQHGFANVTEFVELPGQDGTYHGVAGTTRYADFLARGTSEPLPWEVDDETRTIAINYTSGTTGNPKGVEYSHRGAYLNSLGELRHQRLDASSRYLWSLPMFTATAGAPPGPSPPRPAPTSACVRSVARTCGR